jgi:hypothetical protein
MSIAKIRISDLPEAVLNDIAAKQANRHEVVPLRAHAPDN